MLKQDLHIHTIYSTGDGLIAPEQTVALVAAVKHAEIVGISDHFESLLDGQFEVYEKEVRHAGLKVGVEVDGHTWVSEAVRYPVEYYIFHCRDITADYRGLERLLGTGKPVIVAHPNALSTDLNRVSAECLVEINNRYVFRTDWKRFYAPFIDRFQFILGSDAHQPNWLGQAVAHYVASQLGVNNHLVF
jgi:histidinol phosphatase-like PHP family hydrolase